MHPVISKIGTIGVIPVVVLEDETKAVPLAKALVAGGLPSIEVTFRTKAAAASIEAIASAVPSMLVGAGTVLTVDQVKTAIGAGAEFVVAPGFDPAVVEYCLAHDIPILPGVLAPSEIGRALSLGINVLKLFPIEAVGGLNYLKAVSGPFVEARFSPSGGVDLSNFLSYLKFPSVHACGSSAMVKAELIAADRFDEIERLTAEMVRIMLGFTVRHVGVNTEDEKHAKAAADLLTHNFGFGMREGSSSFFVAEQIEVTKSKRDSGHGHIAIGTNFMDRAIAHLGRKGISTRPDTAAVRNGSIHTVYLDLEIEGFEVHLIQL